MTRLGIILGYVGLALCVFGLPFCMGAAYESKWRMEQSQ